MRRPLGEGAPLPKGLVKSNVTPRISRLTVASGLLLRRKRRGEALYRPRARRENAQKAAHVLRPRRKKQPPDRAGADKILFIDGLFTGHNL